jgi:hypothetical protein
MAFDSQEIVRRQIRFYPTSTTEINLERLPAEQSLKSMKLRYREEPREDAGGARKAALYSAAFVVLGFLYAWLLVAAPRLASIVWPEIRSMEGLPVVLAMLAGMLGLIGLLCLFFVSSAVRLLLLILSLVAAAGSAVAWLGDPALALLLSVLSGVPAAIALAQSVIHFHAEWLRADPRGDQGPRPAWTSACSWSLPHFPDAGLVLNRYFSYHSNRSGAAGVWVPTATIEKRLATTAVFAACVFTSVAVLVLDAGFPGGLLGLIVSGAIHAAAAVWVLGLTSWQSKQFYSLIRDNRSWWQQNVDRLRRSEHVAVDKISGGPVREAEHLFLGIEPWQNFPILLHQPILHDHTYIVGRTGSGKTSIGLMQLLIQIIRGHRLSAQGESTWSGKTPVVVIDLKGDPILFQTAKEEAEKRGQKFRFFTLEQGRASFRFNPFSGFGSSSRSLPQLVQLVLDSLSLNHGVGYGRSYYSHRSRFMLSEALTSAKGVNNFKDLYKALNDLYRDRKADFRDAFELLSVIESLTHYEQLVTTKAQDKNQEENTIQMSRVLEDREVVYFWLPSAMESVSVREVGKLVLFNLRTAAQDRQREGRQARQAFLFIDECQKLAGENFQEVLQQARSGGIAAVLANQSLSDLKTADCDLRPTIRTNTRVKMYFSMSEPEDIRTISDFSGEELHISPDHDSETVRPRLSAKEILAVSDHPQQLLLQVSSGSGYTQFGGLPIPVQTDWPISKSLADARERLPWPSLQSAPPSVLVASPSTPQQVHASVQKAAKAKYKQRVLNLVDED